MAAGKCAVIDEARANSKELHSDRYTPLNPHTPSLKY
jgi:hypothetical protein